MFKLSFRKNINNPINSLMSIIKTLQLVIDHTCAYRSNLVFNLTLTSTRETSSLAL